MRLRRLNLDLFGHFSGKSYDFGTAVGGSADFHIVYGPNEAGKTTTMEGYLRLLYGFDAREAYDFQHQRKNLQVSGVLETAQGALAITRLSTRQGSLIDANGNVLSETAIDAQLGGLGPDDYRKLLCLDDDTIERGGEEIANSKGDIGALLFSAAAGVSDLTTVLDAVDEDASALYRKRVRSTRMAALKKELADIDAQIKAQDVPANLYRKLRQTLAAAQTLEDDVGKERAALTSELAQIKARQAALPLLHKLDQTQTILDPLANYPSEVGVSPDDLVQLLTAQNQAQTDLARLTEEIDTVSIALADVTRAPTHLGLARELATLDAVRSRFTTAQLDLPRRIEQVKQIVDDMQRAAADLGATGDPVDLAVTPAALAQLEQARDEKRAAQQDCTVAQTELDALSDKIAEAQNRLGDSTDDAAPDHDIGDILGRFAVDTLAPAYAKAQAEIANAQRSYAANLAALDIKEQRFDTPPPCVLTSQETDTLAQNHGTLQAKAQQLQDEIDQLTATVAAQEAQIAQMRSAGAIIDEIAAHKSIAARDALWDRHRSALSPETAAAFEIALRQTDTTQAQRVAQAGDLAQLRQLSQSLVETQSRLGSLTARAAQIAAEQTVINETLESAARTMGLASSVAPSIFAAWVFKVEQASNASHTLANTRDEHAVLLDKANRLMESLNAHFKLDTPDFDTLVALARERDSAARAKRDQQNADRQMLAAWIAEQSKRQSRHDILTKRAETARQTWQDLVAQHLQGRVDADRLELSLEPLRALRELDTQRSVIARQVAAMKADQAQFSTAVADLCAATGVNSTEDALDGFKTLSTLSDRAQDAEKQHMDLTARLTGLRQSRMQETQKIADIAQRVADIGSLFPDTVVTTSINDLRDALARTQEARIARQTKADLELQIMGHLQTTDIASARALLDGAMPAALDAQLAQIQGDLDAIEVRYRGAISQRAEAAKDISAITGDGSIAELTQRKATIELEMQDVALRYMELRTGYNLAQEAIRRYRDTHRSGMMHATEQAFSELTNGAYTALRTQPDGQNETLIAVDTNGRAKQAQDMSKGTRFQLYLALRAAAYEQLAQQGTSLPFFCDDIFETFDEARTEAACKMMERIGRRGQAIYLTHHQHVVDIARRVCGDAVHVHEI